MCGRGVSEGKCKGMQDAAFGEAAKKGARGKRVREKEGEQVGWCAGSQGHAKKEWVENKEGVPIWGRREEEREKERGELWGGGVCLRKPQGKKQIKRGLGCADGERVAKKNGILFGAKRGGEV